MAEFDFLLTYAGTQLCVQTPAVTRWLATAVPPQALVFPGPVGWPASSLAGLGAFAAPVRRRGKVGSLYWPSSASRCAVGYFLASSTQLNTIRASIGSADSPADLVMQAGNDSVTASLYLMPPLPLTGTPQGFDDEALFLCTFVDERYFWWRAVTDGTLAVADDVTTWHNLLDNLATLLDITIDAPLFDAGFGLAPNGLDLSGLPAAAVLDAVCYACGLRISCGLSGNVYARGAADDRDVIADNLANDFPAEAGDGYRLDPDQLPAGVSTAQDQPLGLYETVRIVTRADDGFHTDNAAVAAQDPDLANAPASGVRAWFTRRGEYDATEGGNYADAFAKTFGLRAISAVSRRFAGIVPWTPDGTNDAVEWVHSTAESATVIHPPPWHDGITEIVGKASGASSGDDCTATCVNILDPTTIVGTRDTDPDDSDSTCTITVDWDDPKYCGTFCVEDVNPDDDSTGCPTATITTVARTGGTVTLTTSAAHGFSEGDTANVMGLASAGIGLRGTFTLTAVTSTTFSYDLPGDDISSTGDTGTVSSAGCTACLELFVGDPVIDWDGSTCIGDLSGTPRKRLRGCFRWSYTPFDGAVPTVSTMDPFTVVLDPDDCTAAPTFQYTIVYIGGLNKVGGSAAPDFPLQGTAEVRHLDLRAGIDENDTTWDVHNRQELQRALDDYLNPDSPYYKARLVAPPGTFYVDSPVTLTSLHSGLHLTGSGPGATTAIYGREPSLKMAFLFAGSTDSDTVSGHRFCAQAVATPIAGVYVDPAFSAGTVTGFRTGDFVQIWKFNPLLTRSTPQYTGPITSITENADGVPGRRLLHIPDVIDLTSYYGTLGAAIRWIRNAVEVSSVSGYTVTLATAGDAANYPVGTYVWLTDGTWINETCGESFRVMSSDAGTGIILLDRRVEMAYDAGSRIILADASQWLHHVQFEGLRLGYVPLKGCHHCTFTDVRFDIGLQWTTSFRITCERCTGAWSGGATEFLHAIDCEWEFINYEESNAHVLVEGGAVYDTQFLLTGNRAFTYERVDLNFAASSAGGHGGAFTQSSGDPVHDCKLIRCRLNQNPFPLPFDGDRCHAIGNYIAVGQEIDQNGQDCYVGENNGPGVLVFQSGSTGTWDRNTCVTYDLSGSPSGWKRVITYNELFLSHGVLAPIYLYDTTTDPDGTDATVHAPEVGAGWVLEQGSNFAIQSNKITCTGTGENELTNTLPAADIDWTFDFTTPSSWVSGQGVMFNHFNDGNFWMADFEPGQAVLYKRVAAGSLTSVATGSFTFTASTTFTCRLRAEGDNVKVWVTNITDADAPIIDYTVASRDLKDQVKVALHFFNTGSDTCGSWSNTRIIPPSTLAIDDAQLSANVFIAGAWTSVSSFAHSWGNAGGGTAAAAYRRVGDVVEVRGKISGGTGTPGTDEAFTLPSGFRPPATMSFAVTGGTVGVDTGGKVLPDQLTATWVNFSFSVTA